MIIQVLHCPYCQGTDIVRHGATSEGKQRYRCRECRFGRGRTFLLEYTDPGQSPEVKQRIVDMAMNASGVRDTARVRASVLQQF
jgi:transposase-like protein